MTVRINDFSLSCCKIIVVKSVETAKKLNKDCGLVEAEELDKNLKQFLAHIGKSISNIYQRASDYLLTDPKSLYQGTGVEVEVRDTED